MKEIIINKNIKWVDVPSPTRTDIQFLKKNFNFHPIVIDELLHPSDRSKAESYDGYILIIMHLPVYDYEMRSARQAEIDVLVTKDAFITVHYENAEPLEQFERLFQNEKMKNRITNTGQLVYYLSGEIDKFSLRQFKHIEDKVKRISEELFKGSERRLLEEISYVKRDLAALGIIIWPQRNILESLVNSGTMFWGEQMKIYFNDALGDHWRVVHNLNNLKETLAAFEETNSQLLNFKTNEIMKVLTIVAFLTLPLTLFLTAFQIPIVSDFFNDKPVTLLAVLGLIIAVNIVLAVYFRKRKWL